MRFSPFWGYTLARLGVVLAVGTVLWLLGFRSWALAFSALLLSVPISMAFLRKQRREFARDIERRMRQRRELRAKLRGGDE